jgi:hypothetical protein
MKGMEHGAFYTKTQPLPTSGRSGIQTSPLRHLLLGLATTPGAIHAIFPTRRGMVPAVRHLPDVQVAGFEDLNRKW